MTPGWHFSSRSRTGAIIAAHRNIFSVHGNIVLIRHPILELKIFYDFFVDIETEIFAVICICSFYGGLSLERYSDKRENAFYRRIQVILNHFYARFSYRVQVRSAHWGPGAIGRMPSVGVFQRDPSPYLREFRRKSRKTPYG